MIFDNPAERLLEILESGRFIRVNMNCRTAWCEVLELDDPSESQLMSRLGKVMDLPSQALMLLESIDEHDDEAHQYWVKKVSNGFMQQNLNANWDSFINHIDQHSISYLKLCSRLLKAHSNIEGLNNEKLAEIKNQLIELIDEVQQNELDLELKRYLVRSLQRIIASIDEYFISGIVPVMENIESTIGHAIIDQEFRENMRDSEIGNKVWEYLFKVSSIVSMSVGLPELTATAGAILLSAS